MSSLEQSPDVAQWPAVPPQDDVRDLYVSLEREFPQAAAEMADGMSRRRWLQLMGASLALTGTVGCRYRVENIAPFAFRPKDRHPGSYVRYATMIDLDGVAAPLLVNTIDGRPIKIDGNPDHPDSQGASDIFAQSRILDLYDPDRSRSPSRKSGSVRAESTWAEFSVVVAGILASAEKDQGATLAVLAQPHSSPSRSRLKQEFLQKFPSAKWFEYSSIGTDNQLQGTIRAFGKPLRPHFALDQCRVVLAIDADFLSLDGAAVRSSKGLAESRNPDKAWMNRLYSVDTQFTLVSASSDHRISMPPSQIASFVAAVEAGLAAAPVDPGQASNEHDKFLAAVIQDLTTHKGACCVVGGWAQPPEVQAAIWRINAALGNFGKTITFTPVEDREPYAAQIQKLTAGLGNVSTLIILDGNPVYDAPADVPFVDGLRQVKTSIHLGESENETSRECSWFANVSHPLEAWGDGLSYDGAHCIAQPMIDPLYESRSILEFLSLVCGHAVRGREIVRETANPKLSGDNQENAWAEAVHLGFIAGSAATPVDATIADTQRLTPSRDWKAGWESGPLELIFTPSRQLFDGRFANNGWLQELPDFVTKVTWDNVAIVSPRTARVLGLRQAQMVRVETSQGALELPLHVQPGHATGTVTVALGYGRWAVGRVGGNDLTGVPLVGVQAGTLRTVDRMYGVSEARLVGLSGKARLALSQDPFTLDAMGRQGIHNRLGDNSPLIRSGLFDEYRAFVAQHGPMVDESELKTEHDPDWTGHEDAVPHTGAAQPETTLQRGQLPVIQVAHRQDQEPTDAHAADAGHADSDGHASAHDTHWPQGHALHFENKSLTRGPIYSGTHKWAMSIDLTKCNGCNACVIACQAENNVPIVGKDQVARGREMHWIRIDAYVIEDREHDPDAEHADFKFQPVACQHCENAPCETVCPVAATVHSDEGLNDMIYNRCIGTRYCGNNCPYKVRRFNYLNYSEAVTFIKYPNEGIYTEQEKQMRGLGMNPEVTVRSRGVMEKCTYCVQRIQNTKIRARNEKRPIGPNEITTACQDACPTGAIVFGNMADRQSDVHKNHRSVRAYQLLDQLNNLPRTRYLARVRNPHPALARHSASTDHHG